MEEQIGLRVPCLGCVLVAACRYKNYEQMMQDCSIIKRTLYLQNDSPLDQRYRAIGFTPKIKKVYDIIKPLAWEYKTMKGTAHIYQTEYRHRRTWKSHVTTA